MRNRLENCGLRIADRGMTNFEFRISNFEFQRLFYVTRRFLVLGVMLAFGAARAADAPNTTGFDKANGLYEAGKYGEAKQAYAQLVKSGPWSANLFYDLGNTEWKLGNGGEAAADYERALALEPSHPQARANLDFVRGQTGAKTAAPEWWERALQALDPATATMLLSVCGWVALFCIAVVLLRPAGRTGPVVTLTICLLVGGYAGGCLWEANALATKAVVIAKVTQAREAPADVAPVADVLPAGSEVLAPEERGPWTYCTLPDGTRAWVPTADLEKVKQS
jgi:tetratricopeptide (TPR) repeat protein